MNNRNKNITLIISIAIISIVLVIIILASSAFSDPGLSSKDRVSGFFSFLSPSTNFSFSEKVDKIPNASEIGLMDTETLLETSINIKDARGTYDDLSDKEKNKEDIIKSEELLTEKEFAVASSFIDKTKQLNDLIYEDNLVMVDDTSVAIAEIKSLKEIYNNFSLKIIENSDVSM